MWAKKHKGKLILLGIILAACITLVTIFCYYVYYLPSYQADHYDQDLVFVKQTNLNLTAEEQQQQLTDPNYIYLCNLNAGGRDMYIPMSGYYQVCDHIYDASTGAIIGKFLYAKDESIPKPKGLFLRGDYLYYNYGADKEIKLVIIDTIQYTIRDFEFARINLYTMENEKITKREYELEHEKARADLGI